MTKELRNELLSQVVLAISQALFPLVTYRVVTSALGPAGLGKVVYIDSWVQLLGLFAGLGIPLYGIREIAKQKDDLTTQSKIFLELFCLQGLAAIPLLFVLFLIGKNNGFNWPFLSLSLIGFLGNALASEWFLQGKEAFSFITVRTVVVRAATVLLILFFVKAQGDVLIYYAILVGSVLLTTGLNLLLVFWKVLFSAKALHPFQHIKKLNWLFGCYLLFSFYSLTDSVILGTLSTEAAVGTYNLGYRLIRLSTMFILSLGTVFVPKISYLHIVGKESDLNSEMQTSQQILFFFALPFSVFFLTMAPEIVSVLATQSFSAAVAVMRIGSFVPLFLGLSHFAGIQVMLPLQKDKILFFILVACCVLNLVLNFVLVPLLQEKGSAIASLATEVSIASLTITFLLKKGVAQIHWKAFFQYALLSLLILPLVVFFRRLNLLPLVVLLATGAVAVIIYVALDWLCFRDGVIRKLKTRVGT